MHPTKIGLHLLLVEMERRRNDMRGHFVPDLNDVFAQIGFDRGDAILVEKSLSPISSATIVLALVTVRADTWRQMSRMIARASAAVGA